MDQDPPKARAAALRDPVLALVLPRTNLIEVEAGQLVGGSDDSHLPRLKGNPAERPLEAGPILSRGVLWGAGTGDQAEAMRVPVARGGAAQPSHCSTGWWSQIRAKATPGCAASPCTIVVSTLGRLCSEATVTARASSGSVCIVLSRTVDVVNWKS